MRSFEPHIALKESVIESFEELKSQHEYFLKIVNNMLKILTDDATSQMYYIPDTVIDDNEKYGPELETYLKTKELKLEAFLSTSRKWHVIQDKKLNIILEKIKNEQKRLKEQSK